MKPNFKNLFFTTVLLTLFCSFLNAQNFKGGLYAGLATSQIDGDGIAGFDIAGFQAGAFVYKQWKKVNRLQMEIAFIQKGAREKISDSSNFYKARVNYIEIPILYSYRIGNLAFEIGPAVDILVSANEESMGRIIDDPEPPFRTFSLAGIFGITYHFTEKLSICMRSSVSATPARDGYARRGRPFALEFGGAGQRNIVLSSALVYDFLGK